MESNNLCTECGNELTILEKKKNVECLGNDHADEWLCDYCEISADPTE